MGHYLSEMQGEDRILSVEEQVSQKRYELKMERDKALRDSRVVGMVAAIEYVLEHSPIPVDIAYLGRHLGLDGRGPEADAVSAAIRELLTRQEKRVQLTAQQELWMPR